METNQNIDLKISSLHEKVKHLLLEKKDENEIILELTREGLNGVMLK
jgi:hypothetical protein